VKVKKGHDKTAETGLAVLSQCYVIL